MIKFTRMYTIDGSWYVCVYVSVYDVSYLICGDCACGVCGECGIFVCACVYACVSVCVHGGCDSVRVCYFSCFSVIWYLLIWTARGVVARGVSHDSNHDLSFLICSFA